MATKPGGGGVKALVVRPLKKELFFVAFFLSQSYKSTQLIQVNSENFPNFTFCETGHMCLMFFPPWKMVAKKIDCSVLPTKEVARNLQKVAGMYKVPYFMKEFQV